MGTINLTFKTAVGTFSGRNSPVDIPKKDLEKAKERLVMAIQLRRPIDIYDMAGNMTVVGADLVTNSVVHFVVDED